MSSDLFEIWISFLLEIYPVLRLMDYMVALFLIFLRNLHTVFHTAWQGTGPGAARIRHDLVTKQQQIIRTSSVQFSPVAQSCPTLRDPMNHSTPGLPVHHQLPEFTQTHGRRVSDAIQSSHPLLPPSPPAPNPSQHQSLFQ